MKRCSTCLQEREDTLFSPLRRYPGRRAARCRFCHRDVNNRRNRALRVKVLTHYGGSPPRCACCQEALLEFLGLDHIHGGGRQHRKTIRTRWWEWLRNNDYPPGFRVLCHNCNQSLGVYGYCPHHSPSLLATALEAYDETAPSRSQKLTDAQVMTIRQRVAAGEAQNTIAIEYRVSRALLSLLVNQKRRPSSSPSSPTATLPERPASEKPG